MKNIILRSLLFTFCISFFMIGKAYALDRSAFLSSSVYRNSETGYSVYIDDEEDLLSSTEEEDLAEKMIPLTKYGNVGFLSGRGDYSAANSIRYFYDDVFSGKSGLIFFIDMENREIRIQSGGAFYKTITSNVADSITDNVYVFASKGDFYKTAAVAFSQVKAKMEGGFVATPMRWITNFFLAIFLALLFNFTMLLLTWKQNRAGSKAVLGALKPNMILSNKQIIMTNQTKVRLSSSSSRRGGSCGGGFSVGGSSSSGGGGQRF